MKRLSKNYSGFTLIELMVTLAIAGIVLAIGIPSFNEAIRNSRLTTAANELITALNLAKSEAIKRGEHVVVRKTGSQWENGWQVFADIDRSTLAKENVFDDDGDTNLCETGEDCVLKKYSALPANYTLRGSTNFTEFIRYTPLGLSNAMGGFVICDSSDGNTTPEVNTSKLIVVNSVGRTGMGADSDNNGIQEKSDGTEITSCTSL